MTANKPTPRLSNVPKVSGALPPTFAGALFMASAVSSAMAGNANRSSEATAALIHILFLQPLDAFARADHIGQADAEFFVDHNHFAMGNEGSVYQHIQWLTCQPIQLDHRTLVQLQQVANGYLGIPDLHGDADRYIENHIQIRRRSAALGRHAAFVKLFHRGCANAAIGGFTGPSLPGLFRSLGPLLFRGLFSAVISGLFHGCFPFGSQLFVLAQLLTFFLIVSHCVLPSIVFLPLGVPPAHEFSTPACRLEFPWLPCK